MAEYVLHCFAQSGNAYKPALALQLAGADWEPRFVDFFAGETRTPAYRAINVMGEVPMLEHRGATLCQSGVILDYLAETSRPLRASRRRRAPRDPAVAPLGQPQADELHGDLPFHADVREGPGPAVLDEFRRRAEAAWGVLETHLARRKYVVADRLTIADLSLVGYLYFDDEIGVDWSAYPAIRDWLGRIRGEPRWVHPYELMPGHPR